MPTSPFVPSFRMAIASLLLALVCTGTSANDAHIEPLRKMIDAEFAGEWRGGAVLVTRHDAVLLRRAYGMADHELDVPMQPDHLLGIGSITKQMTAVAILKLVEQGRLALDDDVRKYVPDMQTHGRTITIEQVLAHTSGLANFVDRPDFESLARLDHTPAQILALSRDMPLEFEPGTGYAYSDSGYILLGAIIERVTGRPYGEYMENALFRPLGMRNTWYGDDARILPRRARGYTFREDRLANAEAISMTIPHAAGAVFSTVDDLIRWERALRSGEAVDIALLRKAWQPRRLPDGTITGYGLGWKLCDVAGHPTIEQGGFINGFTASLMRLPDAGVTIAVLVNNDADRPDAGAVARRAARLLLTGSASPPVHALSATESARLAGQYRIDADNVRRIFERDGRLYSQRNDDPPRPLYPLSPQVLAWDDQDGAYALVFDLAPDGRSPASAVKATLRCSRPGETAVRSGVSRMPRFSIQPLAEAQDRRGHHHHGEGQ